MTSLFDALAGILADTFGQSVTIRRGAGSPVTITGIFREEPQEIETADGRSVVDVTPVLQVPRGAFVPQRGDIVTADGKQFTVLLATAKASPAADRMIVCILEPKG